MATGWSHTTTENTNFGRLCRLLIDGGTCVLRDVFDSSHYPRTLQMVLLSAPVHATLKSLKAKRVLNVIQWNKLYPVASTVNSVSFDITLLFLLLRNICGLKPPATGWDKPPLPLDKSKEADLIRIKFYRNELYGHITETAIPDRRFKKYWSEISDVLLRLGGSKYKSHIDTLEKTSMDAEQEEYYSNCLKEWEEYEQSLKEMIKETTEKVDAGLQELSNKMDETQHGITEKIDEANEKVEARLQELSNKMDETQHETTDGIAEKIDEANEKVGARLQELSNKMDETQHGITDGVTEKIDEAKEKVDLRLQELSSKMDITHGELTKIRETQEKVEVPKSPEMEASNFIEDYSRRLRSSIIKQTDIQPKLMASHLRKDQIVRTDDIFTNLTIRHGQESLLLDDEVEDENDENESGEVPVLLPGFVMMDSEPESESDEEMDIETDDDETLLKNCAEMFIYPENSENSEKENKGNPKTILVIGKAGIGKTLLCQKLIRDWASGHLFQALQERDRKKTELNFAYLLTFRQLNPLKQQEFDLRDFLNLSCVLDEGSIIDEKTFELILQNKENLLVIIDGYDEYSHLDESAGKCNSEETYPNDPCAKMPMHALIAKLLQKKILEGCVLLITSRPHEARDLEKGKQNFDQLVEIKGFSPSQVIEYVEKYFKADEKMRNVVCDHMRKNKSLASLAHVPMLCFLICYCMEWYITHSKTFENLPVTTADLYSEIIKIFEVKHHSRSQYRKDPIPQHFKVPPVVEATLSKLSELAAHFMKQDKYIFDEDDLRSFGLNKQEVEDLQGSGIIHCGPGFRKSPFAEITNEYSFTHLTVQEYLAAVLFVNQGKIPKMEEVTNMVFHFMVQLLSRKKYGNTEKLMEEILISFKPKSHRDISNVLMSLQFLQDYKDIKFTKRVALDQFREFCLSRRDPWLITFSRVYNSYCSYMASLLDIFSLLNEDHLERALTFPAFQLGVFKTSLKISGVDQICNSLSNKFSPATSLELMRCNLDNSCIKRISEALLTTNLTELRLWGNKINDTGMFLICQSLMKKECKITALNLGNNDATDIGAKSFCETITHENCKLLTLDLHLNNITDQGVKSLCSAFLNEKCKLKKLDLYENDTKYGANYALYMYDLVRQFKPDGELRLWESYSELLLARILTS